MSVSLALELEPIELYVNKWCERCHYIKSRQITKTYCQTCDKLHRICGTCRNRVSDKKKCMVKECV